MPDSLQANPEDRKLGLEYALRQHPWATPGAEAHGMIEAEKSDSPVVLSRQDPVAAWMDFLDKRNGPPPQYGVYHVTTVGQYFIRPQILVNSISNLCDATIVIILAEGERLPGRTSLRAGLVANGLPVSSLTWLFNRALVVKQLYTTTGPTATASATIGGTWVAGQVYTMTITAPNPADPGGAPITATLAYTAVVGDLNNSGTATSFAAAWNANATLASLATAAAVGAVITFTAANPGSLIQQATLSPSATGTGTFVLDNAFAGATNPAAGIAFR
jgi:hypothetical protein